MARPFSRSSYFLDALVSLLAARELAAKADQLKQQGDLEWVVALVRSLEEIGRLFLQLKIAVSSGSLEEIEAIEKRLRDHSAKLDVFGQIVHEGNVTDDIKAKFDSALAGLPDATQASIRLLKDHFARMRRSKGAGRFLHVLRMAAQYAHTGVENVDAKVWLTDPLHLQILELFLTGAKACSDFPLQLLAEFAPNLATTLRNVPARTLDSRQLISAAIESYLDRGANGLYSSIQTFATDRLGVHLPDDLNSIGKEHTEAALVSLTGLSKVEINSLVKDLFRLFLAKADERKSANLIDG